MQLTDRVAQRNESEQLRDMALILQSSEDHPFLAPWWLSPEIAYWSNGAWLAASHESLPDGAVRLSAKIGERPVKLLENHKVAWGNCLRFQRAGIFEGDPGHGGASTASLHDAG